MKHKLLLLLILAGFSFSPSSAGTTMLPVNLAKPVGGQVTVVKPNPVVNADFENCIKEYSTSVDNLFYLTLAAINANNYQIDEIQSRTGYIPFFVGKKPFLASITEVNNNSSMIKITPMDNSYAFSPSIIEKIFLYLSGNIK